MVKEPFKIAYQQPTQQSPPTTTSQESPTPTTSQTNHPQSSTPISFQENPYKFEERHSLLQETLETLVRHKPLSEPQYEPIYNVYPSPLHEDLNRIRYPSQNLNTSTKNRQFIHPRRKLTPARFHFNIPSSPIANPLDLSNSTI